MLRELDQHRHQPAAVVDRRQAVAELLHLGRVEQPVVAERAGQLEGEQERPIAALGLTCVLAGLSYSGGPWPISHSALGELFVLAFFGLAAVGGTYYLHSGTLAASAVLAGAAIGAPAAAVLVVNNHRDRDDQGVFSVQGFF